MHQREHRQTSQRITGVMIAIGVRPRSSSRNDFSSGRGRRQGDNQAKHRERAPRSSLSLGLGHEPGHKHADSHEGDDQKHAQQQVNRRATRPADSGPI
jgi:hypothetical protein